MGWTAGIDDLSELSDHSRRRLEALTPMSVPTDTVLVRPGDTVRTVCTVKEVIVEKKRALIETNCYVGDKLVIEGEATVMCTSRAG